MHPLPPTRCHPPTLHPQSLGDDDTETAEASSATLMETEEGYQPVFLEPRALTNLELVDRMDSLAPITDMKVGGARSSVGQLRAALCGVLHPVVCCVRAWTPLRPSQT